MSDETRKGARRGLWRTRGIRLVTGFNVWVSLVLALGVLLMVNYLSFRYHTRWDFSWDSY